MMSARSWLKRAMLGGAFGVGVTVVVAWYFAVVGASAPRSSVRAAGVIPDPAPGVVVRVFDESRGAGYHLRLASGVATDLAMGARGVAGLRVIERPAWLPADFGAEDTLREEHVGWPMLAMKSGFGTRTAPGDKTREVRLPAMSFPTATTSYTLPLAPIWTGFVLNAMLFGAVYMALAGALEHVRRTHVGRCTRCRYNLGGLPHGAVCPECGTPQTTTDGAQGAV